MKLLQYIFLYPFLYLLSLLPFRALHILSDILYFIGYKLLKYRVKLVKANLKLSFPEKPDDEIHIILDDFYRNFFDVLLETIKLISISKEEIRAHMRKGDVSILEQYYEENRSLVLAIGHFGNWELSAVAYMIEEFPNVKGIYKPVTNKFFDELMIKIRTRFGGGVYAMEDTMNKIRGNMGNLTAIGLLADQNPSNHNAYWYKLMGRDTPVFTSVEMIARRFGFPVVYWKVSRLGRGRYEYSAELMYDKPRETAKLEITHKYIELIERDIKEQPSNWLWTHNRWKRSKEDVH
ncbi:MAG: lysophospholipid acyltransferase family protein [Cyclobacteriaceae bacterium]|nr:lysophospholipid acyltransferase family protein [Cyclobacteriaceae bacterium]